MMQANTSVQRTRLRASLTSWTLGDLHAMPEEEPETRISEVFNLGFRRGANDRAAEGLPYPSSTGWPSVVPEPSPECRDDTEKDSWCSGYSMGYVIGAADSELQRYSNSNETEA
jgi:hypothetical protein